MTTPSLQEVDQYPIPEMLIPRVSKEHDHELEFARGLVREAKRMLHLSVVSGEPVSPSVDVDDAWHEMLMFTRFYQEYARFMGGFIHHDPSPGPPDGGKTYARTKENYARFFKETPDPQYWP